MLVDGAVLGQIPLDTELPRKPGVRSILVRKAGFGRYKREVDGDTEAVLSATLPRVAAARPVAKKPKSVIADPFATP